MKTKSEEFKARAEQLEIESDRRNVVLRANKEGREDGKD
jgi:hypothetical protein